jgi:hypothetical protein
MPTCTRVVPVLHPCGVFGRCVPPRCACHAPWHHRTGPVSRAVGRFAPPFTARISRFFAAIASPAIGPCSPGAFFARSRRSSRHLPWSPRSWRPSRRPSAPFGWESLDTVTRSDVPCRPNGSSSSFPPSIPRGLPRGEALVPPCQDDTCRKGVSSSARTAQDAYDLAEIPTLGRKWHAKIDCSSSLRVPEHPFTACSRPLRHELVGLPQTG